MSILQKYWHFVGNECQYYAKVGFIDFVLTHYFLPILATFLHWSTKIVEILTLRLTLYCKILALCWKYNEMLILRQDWIYWLCISTKFLADIGTILALKYQYCRNISFILDFILQKYCRYVRNIYNSMSILLQTRIYWLCISIKFLVNIGNIFALKCQDCRNIGFMLDIISQKYWSYDAYI